MKKAFTMIELIFVIVILGVLSAVAIPKFAKTKEIADISKGRADVAAIRSSILSEKQSRLIKGDNSFITKLSSSTTTLFTGDSSATPPRTLMTYGVVAGTIEGKWSTSGAGAYAFNVGSVDIGFTYNNANGMFTCDRDHADTGVTCKKLVD